MRLKHGLLHQYAYCVMPLLYNMCVFMDCSHAAKGLGMSRPTLYKRVKEYGIDKRNFE